MGVVENCETMSRHFVYNNVLSKCKVILVLIVKQLFLIVKICLSGDCFVLFQCTSYVQFHIHISSVSFHL